jgi:dephospho-CoA kinase
MFLYPLTNTTENEMKPTVIGCIGVQGAGKDEICNYLSETKSFIKVGFSDPIYQLLWEMNPIISVEDYGDEIIDYRSAVRKKGMDYVKRNYDEIRRWLQIIGTEYGRDVFGPDCWIRALDARIKDSPLVAVRDVRFENEIDYIRSRGGFVVWVQSNRAPERDTSHTSEKLVFADHADYTVQNNTTLVELYRQLDVILADWNNLGVSE